MPRLARLRNLLMPVVIGAILFSAFGFYILYWVPNRQRHLDDRCFRFLGTLSTQIRLTVSNYDKIMDNYHDSMGSAEINSVATGNTEDLERYLEAQTPSLTVPTEDERRQAIGEGDGGYGDPPKIAVLPDEGTHFLYLAFKYGAEKKEGKKGVTFAIKTNLEKMIDRLYVQSGSPFDVLLVAQGNGAVMYQRPLTGVEVARIDTLEDDSGDNKEKQTNEITVASLSRFSRMEQVKIAGARYRLYSEPLQISFLPTKTHSAQKGVASSEDVPETWVICGLVRADHFKSESQLLPYTYTLLIMAVILLAFAASPFLRLRWSQPAERLRARDVITVAVSTYFATALLTLIVSDVWYWSYKFAPATEHDMRALARAIDLNFKEEEDKAFAQLDKLHGSPQLLENLNQIRAKPRDPPRDGPTRENIFAMDERLFSAYPYLVSATWSDSGGKQRVKWTTKKRNTPFIDSNDLPWYRDAKRAIQDPGGYGLVPTQGIGAQYSPTNGENITIFWKLVYWNGKKVQDISNRCDDSGKCSDNGVFCSALVAKPISVMNSVLPSGFQFAVLDPDGKVVFHSDPTRNLREDFFAETDKNPDFRSRVNLRAPGAVDANYMGRPSQFYVYPMSANQDLWTLVVFRDLHYQETLRLQMLSLVTFMFFIHTGAMAFVLVISLVIAHWLPHDRGTRTWLWPDSCRAKSYSKVIAANCVAILLVMVLSRYAPPFFVLICASLVPIVVIFADFVVLKGQEGSGNTGNVSPSPGWELRYFGACATLLVVVSVVPLLCFLEVACDFEHKLFIEHTQLLLTDDVGKRVNVVHAQYRSVHLGGYRERILAGPETQHAEALFNPVSDSDPECFGGKPLDAPFFSYHGILNKTRICTQQPKQQQHDPSPSTCELGSAAGRQLCANSYLRWLSFSYNPIAASDKLLSEASQSAIFGWAPARAGDTEALTQTLKQPIGQARSIISEWRLSYSAWGEWRWWAVILVFLLLLFVFVRVGLRWIFSLDLTKSAPTGDLPPGTNPKKLLPDLPANILVIGSCRAVEDLAARTDVQRAKAKELLLVTQARAVSASDASKVRGDQIDEVIRLGQPLVLLEFEQVLDDPDSVSKYIPNLRRVLSGLNSVVVLSTKFPVSHTPAATNNQWQLLLASFEKIDLNPRPIQNNQPDAKGEVAISGDSYYRWLFSGLSRTQKLVLVHLAQERLVNPNSSEIVSELMGQGMIGRSCGMLTVSDRGFAHFLKHAIPPNTLKHWEKREARAHRISLQAYLLASGGIVVAFLIYTQAELFNTWVAYVSGIAAQVPTILRVFDGFRKGGAKA